MLKLKITDIGEIANKKNLPIFISNKKFNYNINLWGIRSSSKDTKHFNDTLIVFYQNISGHWFLEYFSITTDPSDIILMSPINIDGTAILCEGFHKGLWTLGYHKDRRDHKALVQCSPCRVYRDNDKDNVIDSNLPVQTGMFGINMHRASAWAKTPEIGLYSAGCQVHEDVEKYNRVFIPLMESCVNEGNTKFSYTLLLESEL